MSSDSHNRDVCPCCCCRSSASRWKCIQNYLFNACCTLPLLGSNGGCRHGRHRLSSRERLRKINRFQLTLPKSSLLASKVLLDVRRQRYAELVEQVHRSWLRRHHKPQVGCSWSRCQLQCDQNWILHSGPWVLDCYNDKIQSFYAKSGLFPDHFLNFSGPQVVMFIQILKKL